MYYLQLTYTYAPAWGFGGPSRMLYDYARWIARKRGHAEVISGDIDHDFTGIPVREETLDGISIRRVRVYFRHLVKRALNCVSPSMLWYAYRRIGSRDEPTVMHIAEFRSPVFLYAAILRRLFPRRSLLVHSAFGMLHEKASRLRSVYDPLFMGFMLRSVDIGLVENEHEAEAYREYCRRFRAPDVRVQLLPLHTPGPEAALCELIDGGGDRSVLRRRYGVPEQAFVAIFLGRIHYEKGILRTIDAFLEFARASERPVLLLVVGRDDGFQSTVEAHIAARNAEDRVRVVNDVYLQRFEYYALSDVFLGFPTIYEETMLSSVEALSSGTPLIVSREADIPYVESGGAGFVVDFSNEVVVDRLQRIAADPAGFRHRARVSATTHFTEPSACQALESLIEKGLQHG